MITAGFTIHSPITKSHTTILETDAETDGMGCSKFAAPQAKNPTSLNINISIGSKPLKSFQGRQTTNWAVF